MKSISVIVPAFNGGAYMERFLTSFFATTRGLSPSLIIVDNHSTDHTREIVERLAPAAQLIRNSENRGYAGACNQGMRLALDRGSDICILVNQDMSFAESWLEPLVDALREDSQIGAAQSLIYLYPEKTLINSCGNALHYLGFGFTRCYRQTREQCRCDSIEERAYCSGAAVAYSRVALEKVGLFDESFFMYHEDTDLSWRMRLAGYKTVVVPSSRVYHEYEFSRSIQKFYYIERNRLLTIFRNYSIRTLLLIAPMLIVWEIGLMLYAVLGALAKKQTLGIREKMRVGGFFLKPSTWVSLVSARARVQRLRRVADRDIVRLFTDTIEFQDVENPLLKTVANPMTALYWRCIRWLI